MSSPTDRLPDDLLDVLLFDAQWRPWSGVPLRDAVRDRFGLSLHAYRSRLRRAMDHPSAAALAPATVNRRRMRPVA